MSLVCAALAWGCSGREGDGAPDAASGSSGGSANVAAVGYRCVVRDPVAVQPAGAVTVASTAAPWFARGPGGARAYARVGSGQELRWRDGGASGEVPGRLALRDGAFGWAGERYVAVFSADGGAAVYDESYVASQAERWRDHRVVTLDADHGDPQPVRTALPANACKPMVTEMGGRVLLTWHRRTRDGCGSGEPWAQVLGRRGEPLGPARPLSEPEADVQVRSLAARWDFGRAVVTAQRGNAGLDVAWVLDPTGAPLWSDVAGGVACPASGCVRVRAERENGTGTEGSALHFEPLTGARDFAVPASVPDVRALAVSGDRVLVMHTAQSAAGGCDVTVVDVGLRAVVAEHHDDFLACDEWRVRATARGFVLAGSGSSQGPTWRAIDCPG